MRKADIRRKTNEVDISGELNIDGEGKADIDIGSEPLNHLLTLFSFHGLFDLELKAKGDLEHHIIEDTGIALGKAFKSALGDKEGISRYGCWTAVMDTAAVKVALDISGRPSFYGRVNDESLHTPKDFFKEMGYSEFASRYIFNFMEAFTLHAGISLIYIVESSHGGPHHLLEAFYKALGKALDQATLIDPRRKGVPSTKGIID